MAEDLTRDLVPLSDHHDNLEEYYGADTEYFSLKFHYDGVFRDTNYHKVYYGGSTRRQDVRCYYRVSTLNLMTGLRAVRGDGDIRDLMQWVPTYRVIEVYVESGVYEEQVPIYINPDDEDDEPIEYSSSEEDPSDCDDDVVEIAPPPRQVYNIEDPDEGQDEDFEEAMRIDHEDLAEVIEREELSNMNDDVSEAQHVESGNLNEDVLEAEHVESGNMNEDNLQAEQSKTSSVSTVRVVEDSEESEIEGGGETNNYDEDKIVDEMDDNDSDYLGSEELKSLDGSSEEEDEGKPHYPSFIAERDMQDPHFKLGMRFSNAQEFKDAVNEYSIINRKKIRYYTNEKWRVRAMCVGHCEWMIYASKVQGEDTLHVKTFNDHHSNCRPVKTDRKLSTSWLAKRYLDAFRFNPEIPVEAFKNQVMKDLEIQISTPSGYRTKKKAMQLIDGEHKDQYKDLWDYSLEVKRAMPDSSVFIKRDPDIETEDRFLRLYVCLAPLIKGFKEGCRPLICLDGCFLKGPYKGQLLTAVAVDANNGMWPFAWAVVEQECKASWTWFLECLCNDIDQNKPWVFMSDQCKGLMAAVQTIFPRCEHRFCVRHHHANFRKKHGSKKCKDLLWDCARASTEPRFELCMQALKNHKLRAYEWLMRKVQPKHWCRAFFRLETKSDLLINNHCEIFNAFILSARDKPIISLLQRIKLLLMARIRRCRERMMKFEGKICPRIKEKLEKIEQESYKFAAAWNGGINLRRFQLSGIPCYHGAAAILYAKEKLEDYVDECYHTSTYLKTYDNLLSPLNGKELWEKSTKTPLTAPIVRVQPGRKKKQRNKKNDEKTSNIKLGKFKTVMHCAKCGKVGHNIRRCNDNMGNSESSSQVACRKREAASAANDTVVGVSGNVGQIPIRGRGRPRGSGNRVAQSPSKRARKRPIKNNDGCYVMQGAVDGSGTQQSPS